jgi:hypothetical protein
MSADAGSSLRPLEPSGSVAERLRIQAAYCEQIGSPLYAGLLERAAVDFEDGGVVAAVLEGHDDDPADSMLALRLMGAVNRLVLRGDEPALGDLYAAPEREPEAEWSEFQTVLERNRDELRRLVECPVQTNEVGRCAALYLGEGEPRAFLAHLRDAGARATLEAPLAWLRMEPADELADVRLTSWPGGEERLFARAGYHGSPVELGA